MVGVDTKEKKGRKANFIKLREKSLVLATVLLSEVEEKKNGLPQIVAWP